MVSPVAFGKAAALCAVEAYSFIILVNTLSNLDTSTYEPCEDGCIFLRYIPSQSVPRTTSQHLYGLPPIPGAPPTLVVPFNESQRSFFPSFVFVQNGRGMAAASIVDGKWWYDAAFFFSGSIFLVPMSLAGQIWDHQDSNSSNGFLNPICPPSHDSENLCESPTMRLQIKNHLEHSPSGTVYVGFICVGCALSLIHDVLLLLKRPESTTLVISILSLTFQCLACLFGFVWCLGALETFVAPDSDRNCACYYQLPYTAVLLALATPVLLLYRVYNRFSLLFLAVQHGDFLIYAHYIVPYRMAYAALPSNPTFPLIVESMRGESSLGLAPQQDLTFSQLTRVVYTLNKTLLFWDWCARAIGTLVIGPLFTRVFVLVCAHVGQNGGHPAHTSTRHLLILSVFGESAGVAWVNYKSRLPRLVAGLRGLSSFEGRDRIRKLVNVSFEVLQRIGDLIHFLTPFVVLPPLLGTCDDVPNVNLLLEIWEINCAGVYIFFTMRAIYKMVILNKLILACQIRTLAVGHGIAPQDWRRLAQEFPHWCLGAHEKLVMRFLDTQPNKAEVKRKFLEFLRPYVRYATSSQAPHMEVLAGMVGGAPMVEIEMAAKLTEGDDPESDIPHRDSHVD